MPKINQEEYESEEKEVKDLEWLNNEVDKRINKIETDEVSFVGSDFYDEGYIDGMRDVQVIANQLDEPEVLSKEVPVIPKTVADWIEEVKPDNSLRVAFEYIAQQKRDNHDDELAFWVEEGNSETFARAWLDGFTVEEEQTYILAIDITDEPSNTQYTTYLNKRGIFHSMDNESFNDEKYQWSEKEIRDLDKGDMLLEHFAVKIEELEE